MAKNKKLIIEFYESIVGAFGLAMLAFSFTLMFAMIMSLGISQQSNFLLSIIFLFILVMMVIYLIETLRKLKKIFGKTK